jgi:hypothetical protein
MNSKNPKPEPRDPTNPKPETCKPETQTLNPKVRHLRAGDAVALDLKLHGFARLLDHVHQMKLVFFCNNTDIFVENNVPRSCVSSPP